MAEIDPGEIFDECNERLDMMINNLVEVAGRQGALCLGAVDFLRMKATFVAQISDFMMPYLAASAVIRLVNQQLVERADIPNT